MRVRIYPGGAVANIGDVRWTVDWYEFTAAAKARHAKDPNYEHDHDRDEECHQRAFKTRDAALACAKEVFASGDEIYGAVHVQKQIVDVIDEDHPGVGEWNDAGDVEEFTAEDLK